MKSYLSYQTENDVKDYTKKTSYVYSSRQESLGAERYHSLPEEYDVFTYVNSHFFTNRETRQQELISDCLIYLRQALLSLFVSSGIVCVLPKLHVSIDNKGTITFNWGYSTFRAFLSFDDEKGDYDSYCGIIFQSDSDSVSTRTRIISRTNYKKVIDELLDLVVNNS